MATSMTAGADPAGPRPQTTYGHLYAVMRPGGQRTYMARQERYLGDGVGAWFGFVGDGVDEHGALKWWAEWREDGDPAPRWDSGPVFDLFTEARDALEQQRAGSAS